ncbi:hypothetical protein [Blastococcus saxobsidens]|uniref:hypothetical protein n=1 Tax=Blastococcus saxobsidens TaxID=138336 RepID=UPI0005A0B003|nr:hypothetical protein [Blastococcus saxobsidens]
MDDPGGFIGGDQDEFQEGTVAGGTDGDDADLAVVLLLSGGVDVAPGVEDVGFRDAVLPGAPGDLRMSMLR